ncbi:YqgE/AlgH family protein [Neisseria animalis]|uniref:UPF0301 protein D0T90_10710 n=1 Tax=Neisseria animalis TaxID=492 RepID=A0A5P3MU13_NEIAN|nr:YqgE/AlgH family protein [Neisseria animalis]QEY25093.1 YqgE/AlgH family protein [Neisseria animalis]ROW32412.1 YqgE/AlgH family protein [Neisseria animalis]VEE08081.1 Uncharacterized ACR, COG1678 [Neisseria animalis]
MNLTDHFLIAMPDMDDPFFAGSVVYICEHNEDGALGIIINKPSPITIDMIFVASGRTVPLSRQQESVMMGGPVQVDRGYVVHTPVGDWQSSMMVSDDIALTSSRDVIEHLSEQGKVEKALVSIGYSSWYKGQLERELADNVWLTVEADEHILFDVPYEQRYAAAFAKLGFSPDNLIAGAGHA